MILYLCTLRDITELETVISRKAHKLIYSRMDLWMEIDFIPVRFLGYYGTGMEDKK